MLVILLGGNRTIEEVRTGIRKLENDIAYYEKQENGKVATKDRIKRSIKAYAQYNNRQLADLFEVPFSSDDSASEVMDKLTANNATRTLIEQIEKYKNLKTLLTEFKRKQFKVIRMQYGDTGRIVRMEYSEI